MQTTQPDARSHHRCGSRVDPFLRLIGATAALVHDRAIAAEGRRRTHQVLRGLEAHGWRALHDYALPGSLRIEHVAIGPSGVFVLESRAWHGEVTVDHKGATIIPDGRAGAAWTARGQHRSLPATAAAVVRGLGVCKGTLWTHPRAVVVVWAPFRDGVAVSGGITYVAGERLARWLSTQPVTAPAEAPDRSSEMLPVGGSP